MQKNRKIKVNPLKTDDVRYVIYCRKSSDEWSWQQQQSLLDQLKYCLQYAKNSQWTIKLAESSYLMEEFIDDAHKRRVSQAKTWYEQEILNSAEPYFYITEQVSAAKPHIRPKWKKLIQHVKRWDINGIISYSPDRQARNLVDSWTLIHLIDQQKLDVKYTNFNFENNPSWKMVLGINFVISYNYSNNLSHVVTRGKASALERGKGDGKFKHGYIITKDGFHQPHSLYFPLIKEAFRMKIYEQKSDEDIWKYLKRNDYKRIYKNKETELNKKSLYKIWLDEFYYWILVVGNNQVDLREANAYYKPIIEQSEHQILLERHLKKDPASLRTYKTKDEYDELKPFENKFIIFEWWWGLTFNLPLKSRYLKKLAILKTNNPDSTLKDVVKANNIKYSNSKIRVDGKLLSINADVVIDYVYKYLKSHRKINAEAYEEYVKHQREAFDDSNKKNNEKRTKLQLQYNNINNRQELFISQNLGKNRTIKEEAVYQKQVLAYQSQLDDIMADINSLEMSYRNKVAEFSAFLGTMIKAPDQYLKKSYVRKRKFINLLFSNIIIDNKKRLRLVPKPAIEGLFISSSQSGEARTRDLRTPSPAL